MPSAAVQGDASNLPFADQSFTSAVAILVLHHLKSPNCRIRLSRKHFACCGRAGYFLRLKLPKAGSITWAIFAARTRRYHRVQYLPASARLDLPGFRLISAWEDFASALPGRKFVPIPIRTSLPSYRVTARPWRALTRSASVSPVEWPLGSPCPLYSPRRLRRAARLASDSHPQPSIAPRAAVEAPPEKPRGFFPGHHHGLNRVHVPLVAGDRVQGCHIHQADEPVVGCNDVHSSSGTQNLAAILFQAHVPGNGGHLITHHIRCGQSGQRFANGDLLHAGVRRGQQKPSYDCQPDPAQPSRYTRTPLHPGPSQAPKKYPFQS